MSEDFNFFDNFGCGDDGSFGDSVNSFDASSDISGSNSMDAFNASDSIIDNAYSSADYSSTNSSTDHASVASNDNYNPLHSLNAAFGGDHASDHTAAASNDNYNPLHSLNAAFGRDARLASPDNANSSSVNSSVQTGQGALGEGKDGIGKATDVATEMAGIFIDTTLSPVKYVLENVVEPVATPVMNAVDQVTGPVLNPAIKAFHETMIHCENTVKDWVEQNSSDNANNNVSSEQDNQQGETKSVEHPEILPYAKY